MQSELFSKLSLHLRRATRAEALRFEPRAWLSRRARALFAARPRTVAHWLSALLVWGVLGAYLAVWLQGNWTYLTDVRWHNDDVRTAIFPFHRYGPESALENDPVALEMLTYIPLAVRGLFWLTVPWFGLFAAAKISQGLCIAIIVFGGVLLAGYRRTGIAVGALFLFLFLRDGYVLERIASGLPRSYGFPAIALWLAGALANKLWIRRAAIVLAALTYPSALAMTLGAEGLLALSTLAGRSRAHLKRSARALAITTACSVLAVLPALTAGSEADGKVHTLEQARNEPAFGKSGRLYVLPFPDAREVFSEHFAMTFWRQGTSPIPSLPAKVKPQSSAIAVALIAIVMVLTLVGVAPVPRAAIAFLAGILILYCIACIYAFRLYSPERYYSYGARAAGIAFLLSVVGFSAYRLRSHWRYVVRNVACALTMLGLWLFLGDGVVPRNGLTVYAGWNRPLLDYIASLPVDVRIGSHPSDGDDIPFFAGRATLATYETLQPWLTGSWARQKQRAEDSLTAMYATEPEQVLAYADKYGLTHLLVNAGRYHGNMSKGAVSFEPLTSFARRLIKGKKPGDFVLADPPEEAILVSHKSYRLVSVDKLRELWGRGR